MAAWFEGWRPTPEEFLEVGGKRVALILTRHPRARRYVLRVRPDGSARVTIPRGGSAVEARRFVHRHLDWLERQLARAASAPPIPAVWTLGAEVLWRGERVRLRPSVTDPGIVFLGDAGVPVPELAEDLRPAIEHFLRRQAERELPPRVWEQAARHEVVVSRVTVRDQRSRWGSCSRRRTISLNWRLIQAPPFVSDYIILHELMHLREMNHSARFWQHVELVCPDYLRAERWLKQHSPLLRA